MGGRVWEGVWGCSPPPLPSPLCVHVAPPRYQPSFHGVDLSALRGAAVDEYFRQPVVVSGPGTPGGGQQGKLGGFQLLKPLPPFPPPHPQDTFDIRILMAKSVKYTVNFLEAKEGDLHRWVAATRGPPHAFGDPLSFLVP